MCLHMEGRGHLMSLLVRAWISFMMAPSSPPKTMELRVRLQNMNLGDHKHSVHSNFLSIKRDQLKLASVPNSTSGQGSSDWLGSAILLCIHYLLLRVIGVLWWYRWGLSGPVKSMGAKLWEKQWHLPWSKLLSSFWGKESVIYCFQ